MPSGRPRLPVLRAQPDRLLEQAAGEGPSVADGGNVLSAANGGWLAIDPKPLLGERAFDLASLLRDRRDTLLTGPAPRSVVSRRLDLLSSGLGLERERARGWGIVHALAWGLAEEEVYLPNIACAELLAAC